MSFLVDANVLCEATRPDPDPEVVEWLERHDPELYVSVVTLGEIDKGIQLLPKTRKRSSLQRWFHELESGFSGRTIPIDNDVMTAWAKMYTRSQKTGRLLPSFDSLLAATSVHLLPRLYTENSPHLQSAPVVGRALRARLRGLVDRALAF